MKALIVIDMQNDFIEGALGTKEAQSIVPNVKKKIEEYISNGDEVFFTYDTHDEKYLETSEGKHLPVPHCIEGTEGWQIHPEIDRAGCLHIKKRSFGYDSWGDLRYRDDLFAGISRSLDEIELVGVCTDICVISNALILKSIFTDVPITVDASCCAGVTPETHQAALTVMKSCQINVIGE